MNVEEAARIRRKDAIPPEDHTDKRDTVAEYIEDMWPATKTAIAEEAGVTRRTVSTTLETYFEPVEESDMPRMGSLSGLLDDQEEKLLAVFRMGYRMGWEDRGGK